MYVYVYIYIIEICRKHPPLLSCHVQNPGPRDLLFAISAGLEVFARVRHQGPGHGDSEPGRGDLWGPEGRLERMDPFRKRAKQKCAGIFIYIWLVVWNMTFIFPYIGNSNPN